MLRISGTRNPKLIVTRFAPSPTGHLHLGHAYSALFAERAAGEGGGDGRFLLRMEDIDPTRCRSEFADAILEDLEWLGLRWSGEVMFQSSRMARYAEMLGRLRDRELLYPCFCTRKEIEREIAAAGDAPHGPASGVYPGTCRNLEADERERRLAAGDGHAWRLDVRRGCEVAGELNWVDRDAGSQRVDLAALGDVVLARKEIATSYHLAVTVDDADQEVTLITRGEDLFDSTPVHRLLQALLDLPVPAWQHHRLVTGADGKRFAKRDGSVTLRALRESGRGADDLRRELGF